MTTKISGYIAPIALAALLSVPVAAFAQSPPATPTTPMPPAGAPTGPAAGTPAPAQNLEAQVEQRIDQLHSQLGITPAQQKQWDQFAAVMRANARDMDAAMQARGQQFPTMTALQNMESYAKLAQMHAEHVQKLASAFGTLYNSLPAAQRQAADQAFRANATNPQHAMAPSTTRTQ